MSSAPTSPLFYPAPPRERPLVLLIDGSYAIFRAYYSIRGMRAADGMPTGAIYGLIRQLTALCERFAPDRVLCAFDENDTGFRSEIDPTYKANRGETPEDLAKQWPIARDLVDALGIRTFAHPHWEADDIIATLAARAVAAGMDVVVSSADKDLGQLVRDGQPSVVQHDPVKDLVLDATAVQERWGVPPEQVPAVQALVGDSVDNVRGVKGIGHKTAAALIAEHGSIEALYGALDAVSRPRTRALLEAGRDEAELALRLVTLAADADLGDDWGADLAGIAPLATAQPRALEIAKALRFRRVVEALSAD